VRGPESWRSSELRPYSLAEPHRKKGIDDEVHANIIKDYRKTDPDADSNKLEKDIAIRKVKGRRALEDVLDFSHSPRRSILQGLVIELKAVCQSMGFGRKLENVCYGTVPGGGLDAYSFKIKDAAEYGIIVPEGLFDFANLLTKVVILLQPMRNTPQGLVYDPTTAVDEQHALLEHPYITFRYTDLLEAFFLHGDPAAALPYRHAIPYQDRFCNCSPGVIASVPAWYQPVAVLVSQSASEFS
jgi:hypothetical protein